MPGLAGILGPGRSEDRSAAVSRMVAVMRHEPFYTSGTYAAPGSALWAGWVGLRGSFSDGMPVWNEKRDIGLIFSGEDFTEPGEVARLKAAGHDVSPGKAGYLVHSYEERGSRFVESLNGRFSGVLIDLREGKVLLFNDRYGLGRLHIAEENGTLYFASEAKALLEVLPGRRSLAPEGLAEVFSCGCVLRNRTLFTDISLLPGGALWTFAPGGEVRRESYFRPEAWENLEPLPPEDYYRRLKETWARILPRYLGGGQDVAMSLTGGKDSRMIMAWAQTAPGTLPCYTFGGMYRECLDVKLARRVARVCGRPFQVIPLDAGFLREFPALAERTVRLTDGAMDVTGSPELYVNRIARTIAPVRLTGNYGQEILAGAVAFRPFGLDRRIFAPDFRELVDRAAGTYAEEMAGRRLSFVAFKQVPWHHYSRLSLELSQLTLRSPFLDNDLVALAFQAPRGMTSSTGVQLRLVAEGNPALGRIGTDRALLYRPVPVVTKARHLVREFSFRAEYAFDYGMPGWLVRLDRALGPLRPERLFLGRHKFYHFRTWYRRELSPYVKDVLLDPRTLARPYLDGRRVREIVQAHTGGTGNYTSEIHRLLTSELIERTFIDVKGGGDPSAGSRPG
jgi:asparagine synthase (glutamine-hydrolysing)